MSQNKNLAELSAAGVSVWLDDLSRDLINSGALQDEIDTCFDEVFDYANRKGNVKAKAVLMNHRNVSGGYEDPTDEFEL